MQRPITYAKTEGIIRIITSLRIGAIDRCDWWIVVRSRLIERQTLYTRKVKIVQTSTTAQTVRSHLPNGLQLQSVENSSTVSKTAAMNRTLGSTTQLGPKTPRRQFMQWAVKWFYSNVTEDTSNKPDIPSIICLLQAIGFQLRKFEKREETTSGDDRTKNQSVRVTVECGSSQMEALLEMDGVNCECADNSLVTDGSLWSITGTGPMDNVNKVEKTGSSLLPAMPNEVASLVRDVVYTLVKIINNKEGDINENTDSDWNIPATFANDTITKCKGLVRSNTDINYNQSYKSLTAAISNSSLVNSKFNSTRSIPKDISPEREKPKLKKQGTYDLEDNDGTDEPRPSPPKLASSPVLNQLAPSTSLGHISLQSEEEIFGLADYVVKAHQILDNAVNFIIKRLPLSSSQSSIREDGTFTKPTAVINRQPTLMSSSFSVASTRSIGGHAGASNGSINSLINRSVSSVGSTNSAPSQPQIPKLQKPQARRSGSGLPNMRERSSSFNVNHRTQQQPSSRNLSQVAATARRRTTTAVPSNNNTQRTTAVLSKLPATSKLVLSKSGNSLAVDRTNTINNKRRFSPTGKTPTNSPATQQSNQRSNVSLLKTPNTTNRHSISTSTSGGTSKFGFSASKK